MLEADGIDAIEVSGGMAEAGRVRSGPGLRSEADGGLFRRERGQASSGPLASPSPGWEASGRSRWPNGPSARA
ncbi:MAG: hypothetical protein M0C28_39115 [Candidatus Moduliflexus flocculans]|nr:hypothetical protein [Candidatus Moduliflexus flocculans]